VLGEFQAASCTFGNDQMTQGVFSIMLRWPRWVKQAILISADVVALSAAMWASFAIRLGTWVVPVTTDQVLLALTAPAVALPVFIRMGLYRAVIRYLPERALWTMVKATTLAALAWVLFVFLAELSGKIVIPRSVPIIYWMLASGVVVGSRFLAKRLLWQSDRSASKSAVVIYGAGRSGAELLSAMRSQSGKTVVAFLDDNTSLHGREVGGVRIYSPDYLPTLTEEYGVREVILSLPSLPTARRQEIVAKVAGHGIKVTTLPSITELVAGKYLVSQIREIDIDELLGRSSVPADNDLLETMIRGKTIMVTGAGGSIGSELCRLIARWAPQRLVLFEANEFALYNIDRELRDVPDLAVVPILASVTDTARVAFAISHYDVKVLFHAAAHKHVPMVEANALEGIRNNVVGTKTVVDLAFEHGVENFVLISTDKAVRPTNVMGATKRWAELIVRQKAIHARASGSLQRFSAVRFGNVLGSNGSVVPLFKEQIAHGGPLTLTDRAMTRYFMSIHEAAELIVQAGALSESDDIFLLDMGEPVLIYDLAVNMIKLSGLSVRDEATPSGDIEIVTVGKRPGEKLFEELFYDDANANATRHPKILRAIGSDAVDRDIMEALKHLLLALDNQDESEARRVLFSVIN
jgi:FlaA1/EpsC-like NDP-sugar epimerase